MQPTAGTSAYVCVCVCVCGWVQKACLRNIGRRKTLYVCATTRGQGRIHSGYRKRVNMDHTRRGVETGIDKHIVFRSITFSCMSTSWVAVQLHCAAVAATSDAVNTPLDAMQSGNQPHLGVRNPIAHTNHAQKELTFNTLAVSGN